MQGIKAHFVSDASHCQPLICVKLKTCDCRTSYFDKQFVVYEHRYSKGSTLTKYASDDLCNVLENFDPKELKLAGAGLFW